MTRICFSLLLVLAIPICGFSQIEKIDTDRPDQSESVGIVPVHWIQEEIGFSLQKNNKDGNYEYAYPSILCKYGLGKRIELRLITTLQSYSSRAIPTGRINEAGILPIEIGTKVNLLEEKKWLPKTSLLFHLGFPTLASKNFATANIAPRFRFALQKSITSFAALSCNLGAEWDGNGDREPSYIYTLSPGFDLSEKWYAYVEIFGSFHKDELPEHTLAGGLAWYASNDLKIDLSGGFGISAVAPVYYAAVGVSFRFKTK